MFSVKLFSLIFSKVPTVTAASTAPIPDEPEARSLMRNVYDALVVGVRHNGLRCAAQPIPYWLRAAKRNVRSGCSAAKAATLSIRCLTLWRPAISIRHCLAWPVSARDFSRFDRKSAFEARPGVNTGVVAGHWETNKEHSCLASKTRNAALRGRGPIIASTESLAAVEGSGFLDMRRAGRR
jgi:hypothetical protein